MGFLLYNSEVPANPRAGQQKRTAKLTEAAREFNQVISRDYHHRARRDHRGLKIIISVPSGVNLPLGLFFQAVLTQNAIERIEVGEGAQRGEGRKDHRQLIAIE